MRVTMPSQFVEGAASGVEDALEQIDESSEVHQHIVDEHEQQQERDHEHAHDGNSDSLAGQPLNAEEQKTLASLLRRSGLNKQAAPK